jgi:zinc transport system substrate-binding protein
VLSFVAALLTAGAVGAASEEAVRAPPVVATIKPLHSLVAGVMEGVGEPVLLIAGGASPHDYALRPSEARALASAAVVFWIGDGVETFLEKPLVSLTGNAAADKVVAMAALDDIRLLPARRGGLWPTDSDHDAAIHDMHVWLDPRNGQVMVNAIATTLARHDPTHAAAYAANAGRMNGELEALDRALAARLQPITDVPFIVFHDAFRYFEDRYGLAAAGSISAGPDRPPGARRLHRIRQRIVAGGAACVFAEPPLTPPIVTTLIEGTPVRAATLDPLGRDIPPGPGAYAALLTALADALVACLSPAARAIQPPPSTRPPS